MLCAWSIVYLNQLKVFSTDFLLSKSFSNHRSFIYTIRTCSNIHIYYINHKETCRTIIDLYDLN